MSTLIENVVNLTKRGYACYPVNVSLDAAGTKYVDFKTKDIDGETIGWKHGDYPTDPQAIRDHWEGYSGVAINTGRSGLVVVDIDTAKGKDGHAALREAGITLPDTPLVVRTQSGGEHRYYRMSAEVGCSQGVLAPGVDIRAVGGVVFAPPTETTGPEGTRAYTYADNAKVVQVHQLPEFPADLAERLSRKSWARIPDSEVALRPLTADEQVFHAGRIADALQAISELGSGQRHSGLLRHAPVVFGSADVLGENADSYFSAIEEAYAESGGMDWDNEERTVKDARKYASQNPYQLRPLTDSGPQGRAVIRPSGPTPLADIANALVYHALDLNIFRQGSKPVALFSTNEREGRVTHIEPLSGERASRLLGSAALVIKSEDKEGGNVVTDVLPASLVGPALQSTELAELPRLDALITRPVLLPNGEVIRKEGYHPEEGVYFAPTRPTPELPTREEAVELINSVTAGFPFKTEGDRHRFIGSLFLPAVRDYASGSLGGELNMPGVAITAAVAGTGKSYAAALLSIANGGNWAMQTGSKESGAKEDRNAITSLLLTGSPVVVFDNVKTSSGFGGAVFDSLLTSPRWSDRLLGGNTSVELLNDRLWVWTGNNVYPNGDTAERVIHVRLDTNDEDPGSRPPESFPIGDMQDYFKSQENRDKMFAAILALSKGWHDDGAVTDDSIAWRQYSGICRIVGGIMSWAGLGEFRPTEGRIEVDSHDGEEDWTAFFEAMHRSGKSWSPKELASGYGMPTDLSDAASEVFRPKEGHDLPTAKYVGLVLSGRLDTIHGDLKLVKAQNPARQLRNWQVVNRNELALAA